MSKNARLQEPSALVDFERRWKRVRNLMRQHDVAAVVISENGRSRYLTGYQRYFTATHVPPVHAVVVTLYDGPFLLLPAHVVLGPGEHRAKQIVPLGFGEDARASAIGALLRNAGAAKDRVAVEFGFLSVRYLDKLAAHMPDAALIDVEPIMSSATMIKFPDEIAILREAARLVDEGVAAAVAKCVRGASELDIAARASARMLKLGAEFINHMTVRAGSHASGNFPFPTQRRLADGECVQIDIGCVVGGYVSDTNRTVVVGRASADQKALFEVGQRMLEAAIEAVRPGVSASMVYKAAFGVAERAGMEARVSIPFAGHGIGLSLQEPPFIDASATTILQPGMVLALEPGVYAEGVGGSRPEEMILVTDTGCEVLTKFPRDADLEMARHC